MGAGGYLNGDDADHGVHGVLDGVAVALLDQRVEVDDAERTQRLRAAPDRLVEERQTAHQQRAHPYPLRPHPRVDEIQRTTLNARCQRHLLN